jgi:uncharacterized protein with HEPN domain
MKDDGLYLVHIHECIQRIEQYVREGREAFMRSTLVQDGVIRNLQVMAESTQRLSDAFKQQHSKVDWRALSGFRNVLVHDYLGVDKDRVWQIVERNLPELKHHLPQPPAKPSLE